MKRVVSVSLGSSLRDKSVETMILGEKYFIERIGTDGSMQKAVELIASLDGKVDAFGLGGIDLYLSSGYGKRYIVKDAVPIVRAAKKTPIADGTGIKNTLEKKTVEYLKRNNLLDVKDKRVLITCAVDRYKMAEGFVESGSNIVIGDLIFALGIPMPIKKLKTFNVIASLFMPLISKLPFEMLYPTGEKQKQADRMKFSRFYEDADIIAGDFHYIKKYMPYRLNGKTVITNTITTEDVEMLQKTGANLLITTTPEWEGRSFGTNVVEAILISVSNKKPEELSENDYYQLLERLGFKPRVVRLNYINRENDFTYD